jgi:hypothetical protein
MILVYYILVYLLRYFACKTFHACMIPHPAYWLMDEQASLGTLYTCLILRNSKNANEIF